MNRMLRVAAFAVLFSALVAGSGCSTLSKWFGWGDDTDNPNESVVPAPGLEPGKGWESSSGPMSKRPGEWTVTGPALTTVYFAYDQSTIGTTEQTKLEQVANYLLKNKDSNLIIEGNCDERGSIEYNRGLGERRAIAVRAYLTKLGVADQRMQTISYGSERPAVQGHDEAAWAKNRRADLMPAK